MFLDGVERGDAGPHLVFRALRYEPGYAGLADQTLTPEGPLRLPVPASGVRPTATRY